MYSDRGENGVNGTFNVDDLKSIETYSSLLANHGDSFRALGWGSSDSQRRRFEVIGASGIQPGDSVLDVGCGLADLNAWFLDNLPGVTYSGIDITKNMASKAKERFPNVSS